MAELQKYIYCIILCHEDRIFDAVAIGNGAGVVRTISHEGLAAVVSDSPVKHYESTRQYMMAHQRVIETVMREFTLLPVRFSTITSTESADPLGDIRKLLSARFEEFHGLLRDLEGKVELGLKAFWRDEKAIFEEIVADNADIRKLRNSLSGKSPEAIRFDGIPLGRLVKEALGRKRSQEAAGILLPLQPIAHRVQENDTLVDRAILNAAFLVDKEQEQDFDRAIRELDERWSNRIAFKYVGPVPPYNFVNIVVNWQEL
ncbi:MAG: GvpL/GvpF family gas vesicle protein [Dehalococcoidia bacterium]|nr:GvpL/GvpF family gas vesicle protein [Dehalococcoidia bacterium]